MKHKIGLCLLLLCLTAAAMPDRDPYDPWDPAELLTPARLATELKTFDPARHILYVGFARLYSGTHIPRAVLAGPGSKPKGIELLAEAVKKVPHDAEIILYCGCCPFVRCPNIRPAYKALKDMGYTHIKVLQLNTNLHNDWVEKGFPIELSTR